MKACRVGDSAAATAAAAGVSVSVGNATSAIGTASARRRRRPAFDRTGRLTLTLCFFDRLRGFGEFDVAPPTRLLVICPPPVIRAGSSVHGAPDEPKVRRPLSARPLAAPDVPSVVIDFIVEIMEDGYVESCLLVESLHLGNKWGSMSIVATVFFGDKEKGVDHLMKKCLLELFDRAEAKQRL